MRWNDGVLGTILVIALIIFASLYLTVQLFRVLP